MMTENKELSIRGPRREGAIKKRKKEEDPGDYRDKRTHQEQA